MKDIPKKYDHRAVEEKWRELWEESGVYRWDPQRSREESFVVDSPPLTVSGSLHVGHAFSYTHQDLLVRFRRMQGRNIAYPMGWDDNGLPTERRVQNVFGVVPTRNSLTIRVGARGVTRRRVSRSRRSHV